MRCSFNLNFCFAKQVCRQGFVLLGWMFFISSNVHAGWFDGNCPDATNSVKPEWVKQGFNAKQTGFRVGFGEARYHKNASYQNLLDEAENRAREDIANSVQVEVTSVTDIATQLDETSQSSQYSQQTHSTLKSRSHIDLPGLPIANKWQDADNCTVYVQVRIAEVVLQKVLKKTQAERYYKEAGDTAKPIKSRVHSIREAIAITKQHEFGDIQGSKTSTQLLGQYEQRFNELKEIAKRNNHAVFVINQTGDQNTLALNPLKQALKSSLPGSFEVNKPCTTSNTCLRLANETPANFASIAKVEMNLVKQNGFWLGQFIVELSRWDLSNNHLDKTSGKLRVTVMNRHKHKLSLDKGMTKWQKANGQKLAEFMTFIQK